MSVFAPDRQFRRIRILGEGGSSRVWLVEDAASPEHRLALKELTEPTAEHEAAFRREFATLASLRHPNLVEVHDYFDRPDGEGSFFTLEYVDGPNLVTAIQAGGAELCLDLAVETLRALAFLHDFGIIHRDLKPENLLVRPKPRGGHRLVILDFGLARATKESEEDYRLAGTLPYLAPEVLTGNPADRRSDLYSVGALVYEAIHGELPFDPRRSDFQEFVTSVCQGKRKRPRLPDGFPQDVGGWLDEMLHPDPVQRPAHASEALARLNAATGSRHPLETRASRAARLASGMPPGREPELKLLWQTLSAEDEVRVVWLSGDAGHGKTHILKWLRGYAVREGWTVLSRLPEAEGDADSILDGLEQDSRHRPILLLLDEVENADGGVWSFLERVARERSPKHLRVVAGLRLGEVQQSILRRLIDDTGSIPTLGRVDLVPLRAEGMRALAARVDGGKSSSPDRIQKLLDATEGIPLLAETLLIDGDWVPKQLGADSIVDSFRRRISFLSPTALKWLEVLSVCGANAEARWINETAELVPDAAQDAAMENIVAGLALREGSRWSPASRVVSQLVLEPMDQNRSRDLHREAARWLIAQDGPADPTKLARLWRGAGEQDRSIRAALDASSLAERRREYGDAANWCRFSVLQLPRRDTRRRDLRERHAMLLKKAGQQLAAYRALATVRRLTTDPVDQLRCVIRQSTFLANSGKYERALKIAREARLTAEKMGAEPEVAMASRSAGVALHRLGRSEDALVDLEDAVTRLRGGDHPEDEAQALVSLALCRARLRLLDEAEATFHEAIKVSDERGDHRYANSALLSLGMLDERRGRPRDALGHFEKAQAHANQYKIRFNQGTLLLNQAHCRHQLGELDRALGLVAEARVALVCLGNRDAVAMARVLEADILSQCGRPARAIELLTQLLQEPRRDVQAEQYSWAKLTLAEALLEAPQPDEERLRTLIEEVLEEGKEQVRVRLVAWILELERCCRPGHTEGFDRAWGAYQETLTELPQPPEPPLEVRVLLARARAAMEGERFEDVVVLAEQAAGIAENRDLPALGAQARALAAGARQRQGRSRDADVALEQAKENLEEAGQRIEDEEIRRDFLNRPPFAYVREHGSTAVADRETRLLAVYDMIRALNSETDPEVILEQMLDNALKVVRAERGMILLRDDVDQDYTVRLARNLESETIEDAAQFSRNVVLRAAAGKPVLAIDTDHDERLRDLKSVSMYGIRSVLCVPLKSRGKVTGAVYLDSRVEGTLFSPEDLRFLEAFADNAALALVNARVRQGLERENRRLQVVAESRARFENLIGQSPPMQKVYDMITRVAETSLPVLIYGESGTGKELVARAIHYNSARKKAAYLSENCAAIPEALLESELFGHVKGSFTGAERDHVGLFEQADGGTLFLDEVGDMPRSMQARLLRVLQEGELRRVGGDKTIQTDVRVIAATHRDLQKEVEARRFREDLMYRLMVLVIELPPLRDRPGDVALLTGHFMQRVAKERGRPVPELRSATLDLLERYHWPGNVRQLENTVQRLLLIAGDAPIDPALIETDRGLRKMLLGEAAPRSAPLYSLEQNQKERIQQALKAAGGNRTRAAKLLGISRATIFRKIKEYGL